MYITEDTGDIYVFTSETDRLHLNADKATYLRNADGTANYDYATIEQLLSNVANLTEDFNNFGNTYKEIKLSVTGGDFTVSGLLNEYNTIAATNGTLKTVNSQPGNYGLATDSTPEHGESFVVPYVTVDGKGRVTAASTHTVTLPSVDDINSSLNDLQAAVDALEEEAADIRVDFVAADATTLASAKSDTDEKLATLKSGSSKTIKNLEDSISALTDTVNNHNNTLLNRKITAGAGLTGGGDLTTNRTLNVGAGAGISVTADAVALATSGVTAGNYGPSANASPEHGKGFSVPYVTVDTYGRVTAASTKTITLPSVDTINNNINTLSTDLAQEIADRTNAISTEASARSTGDTDTLKAAKKYTDDELAAIVADSESTLASIDKEIDDLQSADNTINATLNQEIADRTTAVSNEASARSTGDANTLTSAKKYTDDEIDKVTGTSTSTLKSIDTAIANLQSADNTLSSRTITAGNGLTGGGDLTANRTLAVGAGAGISVTADAVALATSGVTAGNYGPSANASPEHGKGFSVPYVTVDTYGRVTAASTKTITLPSVDTINNNINTLSTDLAQEIANRKAADEALETAYKNADATLKSSYEAADNAINTTITNLKNGSTKTIKGLSDEIASAVNNHNAINIQLTGVVAGSGTISSNKIAITTSNSKLTIGDKEYDGSNPVTIYPSDLGLSAAIIFLGTTTSDISDGSATNPITIGGKSVTATNGNVVLYDGKEFIWTGSLWELFGDEGSYALKTVSISAGTGLTGGGNLSANRTLSLATSGVTAGSYGPSANASPAHSGTFSVPYVTVDTYGRVTSASTKTITLPAAPTLSGGSAAAADATVVGGVTVSGHTVTVGKKTLTAGSNVTITGAADKITIAATDTTYGTATTSANGLMTAAMVTKLNGIANGATANTGTVTSVAAGTGLSGGTITTTGTLSLATSGVTAGSYGPTANVSGSNGATISVPQITVDAYGRVTSVVNRTYTSVNTDTNTDTQVTNTLNTSTKFYITGTTSATTNTGTQIFDTGVYVDTTAGKLVATSVYGAVWNDYAEYRETRTEIEPGRVVCENGDDTLSLSTGRLQPGANIVSDTFGFAIGETEQSKTPLAVSGRVLAYPFEDRYSYKPGDAVCAGPDGTVSKMSREEIMTYPECILGTVSAIPEYETWGEGNVPVNGRIWIKVR